MKKEPPLIVGAGPVGLGAALYLAEANIKTRVIFSYWRARDEFGIGRRLRF